MEIAGYIASIFIGISLGLIGGGGSILTVPVLVYLFGIDAVLATTYSLFIVGASSLVGSITYCKKGLVNLKTVLIFGVPSVVAVLLTRTYILPFLPQEIFSIGNFILTKNILLMLLFAVLMVLASYSMIKNDSQPIAVHSEKQPLNILLILSQGVFTGVITGLIGAGGGFLIIPALVAFVKLPMKKAVGTSLVIISISSLTGFSTSLTRNSIQWSFLLTILCIAIIGILIGSHLSTKIDGKKLRPAFGWFVLIMGIYIIIKEIWLK